MTLPRPTPRAIAFALNGDLTPLLKAVVGPAQGWRPTRPLGGWLATYGHIGPRGGVVPTQDRDGHVFEAAQALGRIDFGDYLRKGRWNDLHNEAVIVGVPTLLEFHDETTELAKAHGKVGFWTEGHLFDRADPESWERSGYAPSSAELDRSDYYWQLAQLLKGTPRSLCFSAHGKMLLSPCEKRIIWARVPQGAICEIPKNPDATAQPLELAVPVSIGMVGRAPCETCTCPAGACLSLVKAIAGPDVAALAPEDLERSAQDREASGADVETLVSRIVALKGCTPNRARRWVLRWQRRTPQEASP